MISATSGRPGEPGCGRLQDRAAIKGGNPA